MTIITGIIGIVLYVVILKVVYGIEDSVLQDNDIVKIELFDLQGRRVYRSNHTTNQSLFDEPIATGKLASGIYVLNVSQGNKSTTKRIIFSK